MEHVHTQEAPHRNGEAADTGEQGAVGNVAGVAAVESFFRQFERAFNRALIDSGSLDVVASSFSHSFIAANPNGVLCWKNDENMLDILKQGFDFYRSLGSKSARIAQLTVTMLDQRHALVKVRWEMLFARTGGEMVSVSDDIFYLVQVIDDEPKIISFVTPDEKKTLRERGLMRLA